ncbi:hypothetical protein IM660_14030 [Ruania alkalisoli]|uniref:Spore protein YkvP/CgeB glycosyl transferase-like domain-containing protein n=1 Tax=Ruania alkalisoli TaxID=2779775 RepID=A0A7M1ST31_9MICO|nr:hypothetical protein [Ruania alkalisoli]QOR69773.1 hypothetical protein IM660_14030 [Ruania alkalisoli]
MTDARAQSALRRLWRRLPAPVRRRARTLAGRPPTPTARPAPAPAPKPLPEPVTLPDDLPDRPQPRPEASVRLFVGPANHAGQGYRWARAVERDRPQVSAVAFAPTRPGGFSFAIDYTVPLPVYWDNELWARDQLAYLESFTHVLVEAQQPLLGLHLDEDFTREVAHLADHGVRAAAMCHGSDIRLPSRHVQDNPWSPFLVPGYRKTVELEALATLNAQRLTDLGIPVFVSTPDLLDDVPAARWCPVVVDTERWHTERNVRRPVPVVAHAPSRPEVKGSDLVEPTLHALHEAGVIEYRRISRVPARQMPEIYRDSDIVLDQFRIGSYGVAACEAMAAGCVVLGNVREPVRERVRAATGTDLPLVQADPDTLEEVLRGVVAAPERVARLGEAGVAFANQVHDGTVSANVLRTFLDGPR